MTFTYQTERLTVSELFDQDADLDLLERITDLLTPQVVENLPPHFANIMSTLDAKLWFLKMVSESTLLSVKQTETQTIIGFVFLSLENSNNVHIGYLLGKSYWKKGYATELLKGLVDYVNRNKRWNKLIAGVDINNMISSKLLLKLGFIEQSPNHKTLRFYECQLSQTE